MGAGKRGMRLFWTRVAGVATVVRSWQPPEVVKVIRQSLLSDSMQEMREVEEECIH